MSSDLIDTRYFRIGIDRNSVMMAISRAYASWAWRQLLQGGHPGQWKSLKLFAIFAVNYLGTELKWTRVVFEIKDRAH